MQRAMLFALLAESYAGIADCAGSCRASFAVGRAARSLVSVVPRAVQLDVRPLHSWLGQCFESFEELRLARQLLEVLTSALSRHKAFLPASFPMPRPLRNIFFVDMDGNSQERKKYIDEKTKEKGLSSPPISTSIGFIVNRQ